MSKVNVNFFGRNFDLNVVFDCYEGEEILISQKDTLKYFLENNFFGDSDLKALKEYCLSINGNEIGDKIDNIFKYVIPIDIYLPRTNKTIAIMCRYKFDLEHGLALVYKNGELKKIGKQDIVL